MRISDWSSDVCSSDLACSLTKTDSFDSAADWLEGKAEVVVITRSEKGAVVLAGGERHAVPAAPVGRIVDTTGAGDLFAAGFLAGLAQNRELPMCAHMGAIAAAEVISHYGARPAADLRALEASLSQILGRHSDLVTGAMNTVL